MSKHFLNTSHLYRKLNSVPIGRKIDVNVESRSVTCILSIYLSIRSMWYFVGKIRALHKNVFWKLEYNIERKR